MQGSQFCWSKKSIYVKEIHWAGKEIQGDLRSHRKGSNKQNRVSVHRRERFPSDLMRRAMVGTQMRTMRMARMMVTRMMMTMMMMPAGTCSTAAAVEVARVFRGAQAMFTDI